MRIYDKNTYGIIRRNDDKAGLFSFFITIIGAINYSISNNIIPVVDMKTGDNIYKTNENNNAWEHFFEQPYGVRLEEIPLLSKKVMIDSTQIDERPNMTMEFLLDSQKVDYWRNFVRKYIRLSNQGKVYYDAFSDEYMCKKKKGKTIGVLYRGTDYIELKPQGHPVQPSLHEMKKKIDEFLIRYEADYIFLVTEDENAKKFFQKEYEQIIIVPNVKRFEKSGGTYLADCNKEVLQKNSYEYLASIFFLAKCNYLIAGRTSGSVSAYILGEFEDVYFFDKGVY